MQSKFVFETTSSISTLSTQNLLMNLSDRVSRILLTDWDPIGINRIPECTDEYESYVSGLCQELQSSPSKEEIALSLMALEQRMGLAGNRERCTRVAELLLVLVQ